MPDLRVAVLKTLVEGFASLVQGRAKRREGVFEDVVLSRFETLRAVHRSFHSSLLPVKQALADIERGIRLSGTARIRQLAAFRDLVSELNQARYLGHPDRRELYDRCQFLARSGFRFSSLSEPLDQDERALVTRFMNDICAYFASNDRYEHEYGNAVAGLIGFGESWSITSPSSEDVAKVHEALDTVLRKMDAAWSKAVEDFSRLEASLKANIRPDRNDNDPPTARIERAMPKALLAGPSKALKLSAA